MVDAGGASSLPRAALRWAVAVCLVPLASAGARQPFFLNINPSWSPDGRQLVFQSARHGSSELYVVDADGGGERRLTWNDAEDTHPSWSPDGWWIVFDSSRDGVWNLYLIRPDGTGERWLTHRGLGSGAAFARHPTWSPDGRRLAFYADPEGRDQFFVVDLASGEPAPLAPSAASDQAPAFSPDGTFVAFTSTREGGRDLLKVEVTTGAVTSLTRGMEGIR